MRKSHIIFSAVSLATLTTMTFSNADAAWAPALPSDAGIIAEVDNQTSPLTFPRPDQQAPTGGILGSFKVNSMKGHSALIKSYPVEVRVSKSGRLEVRNLKTGDLITHSKALSTGVTYKYQVSCGTNGWNLVVNGTSNSNNGSKHPTCLSEAWGKPVIAASSATGTNALSGTLDLTWYADDGTGSGGGSGGGGGDDSGDGGTGGTTTPPGVSFVGDFETGDLSQWPSVGALAKHKYAAQASNQRRRGGRFAGRTEVRYMDRGLTSDGSPKKLRAEIFEKAVPNNSEWWYGWSSMADPAWKDENNTWYIVQQFHQHGLGSPPLFQRYAGGKWSIRCLKNICGGKGLLWEAKVPKDQWQDFIYQVRWSPKNDGLIRVWRNGTLIVDYKGPTAYEHRNAPYFKFGIYRGGIDRETQIMWLDEYRRGGSKAAVNPKNYR